MSRTVKEFSMNYKNKSCLNNVSIMDAENFEHPQQSSTPSKTIRKSSRRILRDNNSLNISVINKHDENNKIDVEIDNQKCKHTLPAIEENYNKYNRVPELFYSDPEEESIDTNNISVVTGIHDSDDKWMTFSDISENQNSTDISNLLAEIDADVKVRFNKPPRRSYPGRKRSNKSLFVDEEENEEMKVKISKKEKKPKQKIIIDPEEEAYIKSINEHFNDIESFSLAVE